jgi:starch synthase
MKKIKIVSISSELSPFSKTGGLGDVARSLPKAIKRLGHNIIAITPLYEKIIDKKEHKLQLIFEDVKLILNSKETVKVNYWKGYLMEDLPVYFVEQKKYFSRKRDLYGSSHENARFLIFDVAALKLISLLKFEANIIHCHDWQTGLIPFYLKTNFRYSKTLKKAKSIFTIHNLVFQFGRNWWEIPPDKKDYGRKKIPRISSQDIEYVNFAKRAILSADAISTVSEQYREEIMTKKFGQDLHRILKNREERLFGIVNGIDYKDFNPVLDSNIHENYDHNNIEAKKINKKYLQKKLGLPSDESVPLLCTTSRVTFQKGFELILGILDQLSILDAQIVFMGDGDKKYISRLKKFQKIYPDKIVWMPFSDNQKYETSIYAGSDLFLLPSHHEPCGINQLIAMRYGCIPVVRRVGGLSDTVENFDAATGKGTGFSFIRFNDLSLYGAIVRALEAYKQDEVWKKLVSRTMQRSSSWEIPAKNYIKLYKNTIRMNGGENNHKNNKKK